MVTPPTHVPDSPQRPDQPSLPGQPPYPETPIPGQPPGISIPGQPPLPGTPDLPGRPPVPETPIPGQPSLPGTSPLPREGDATHATGARPVRLSRPLGGGCAGTGAGGRTADRTSAQVFPAPGLLTLTPGARRPRIVSLA